MDWQWIDGRALRGGLALTTDWQLIGMDWRWIGDGLASNWQQIDAGLAPDRHRVVVGLALG